jgi:hypothetical protein
LSDAFEELKAVLHKNYAIKNLCSRNSILKEATACLLVMCQQQNPAEKTQQWQWNNIDEIPGLRTLVEYIESLRQACNSNRKSKVSPEDVSDTGHDSSPRPRPRQQRISDAAKVSNETSSPNSGQKLVPLSQSLMPLITTVTPQESVTTLRSPCLPPPPPLPTTATSSSLLAASSQSTSNSIFLTGISSGSLPSTSTFASSVHSVSSTPPSVINNQSLVSHVRSSTTSPSTDGARQSSELPAIGYNVRLSFHSEATPDSHLCSHSKGTYGAPDFSFETSQSLSQIIHQCPLSTSQQPQNETTYVHPSTLVTNQTSENSSRLERMESQSHSNLSNGGTLSETAPSEWQPNVSEFDVSPLTQTGMNYTNLSRFFLAIFFTMGIYFNLLGQSDADREEFIKGPSRILHSIQSVSNVRDFLSFAFSLLYYAVSVIGSFVWFAFRIVFARNFLVAVVVSVLVYMWIWLIFEPRLRKLDSMFSNLIRECVELDYNTIEPKKRLDYLLKALACLDRPFPDTTFTLTVHIIWEVLRAISHTLWFGLIVERLFVSNSGFKATQKALAVYFAILRRGYFYQSRGASLYLLLAVINLTHVLDYCSATSFKHLLAESYSLVSYYVPLIYPSLPRLIPNLFDKLACDAATQHKDARNLEFWMWHQARRSFLNGEFQRSKMFIGLICAVASEHVLKNRESKVLFEKKDATWRNNQTEKRKQPDDSYDNLSLSGATVWGSISTTEDTELDDTSHIVQLLYEHESFAAFSQLALATSYFAQGNFNCCLQHLALAEKLGTLRHETLLLHSACRVFLCVGIVINPSEVALSTNTEWVTARQRFDEFSTLNKNKRDSYKHSTEVLADLSLMSLICYHQNKKENALQYATEALNVAGTLRTAGMPWSLLCVSAFVDVFFHYMKDIKQQNWLRQQKFTAEQDECATDCDYGHLLEKDLTRKMKQGVMFLRTLSKNAVVIVPDILRLEGCFELLVYGNQLKAKKIWKNGYNLTKKLGMKYQQAKFLCLLGEYIDFPEICSELTTKKDVLIAAKELFTFVGAVHEAAQCVAILERVISPVIVNK